MSSVSLTNNNNVTRYYTTSNTNTTNSSSSKSWSPKLTNSTNSSPEKSLQERTFTSISPESSASSSSKSSFSPKIEPLVINFREDDDFNYSEFEDESPVSPNEAYQDPSTPTSPQASRFCSFFSAVRKTAQVVGNVMNKTVQVAGDVITHPVTATVVAAAATGGIVASAIYSYEPTLYASCFVAGLAVQRLIECKRAAPINLNLEERVNVISINEKDVEDGYVNLELGNSPEAVSDDTATTLVIPQELSKRQRMCQEIAKVKVLVDKGTEKTKEFIRWIQRDYGFELHGLIGGVYVFFPTTAIGIASGFMGAYVRNQWVHFITHLKTPETNEIEKTTTDTENPPHQRLHQKIKQFIQTHWPSLILTPVSAATLVFSAVPVTSSLLPPLFSRIMMELSIMNLARPIGQVTAALIDKGICWMQKHAYSGALAKLTLAVAGFIELQGLGVTAGYILYNLGTPWEKLMGMGIVGLMHGSKDYQVTHEMDEHAHTSKVTTPQTLPLTVDRSCRSCCKKTTVKILKLIKDYWKTAVIAGLAIEQLIQPNSYYGTIILGTALTEYYFRFGARTINKKLQEKGPFASLCKKYIHLTDKYQFDLLSLSSYFQSNASFNPNLMIPKLALQGFAWGTYREDISSRTKNEYNPSFERNELVLTLVINLALKRIT